MAEKEYIERGAAMEEIKSLSVTVTGLRSGKGVLAEYAKHYKDSVFKILSEAPAADVAEVRHGEWVQNPYCKRIFYCSECGSTVEDGSYNPNPSEHFPYCHCGAKMDGERKEQE